MSFHRVLTLPGVAAILAVIFVWMLAHNTMYTDISADLRAAGVGLTVDTVLVVFGGAAAQVQTAIGEASGENAAIALGIAAVARGSAFPVDR